MDAPSLTSAVRRELLAYPGVTEGAHRFGGIVFRLGRQELGHLHGERVADLRLPVQIRDELVASGRLSPHHAASDSAWVSRSVSGPQDVEEIVELFRISYQHAAAQAELVDEDEEQEPAPTQAAERRATWRDVLASPARPILRRRNRRA